MEQGTAFGRDGVHIVRNFLSDGSLGALNQELDLLFSSISCNGSAYSTVIDRTLRSVSLPTLIRSVNLLEVVLDVIDEFGRADPDFLQRDYILTNLDIFLESHNPIPLFWHTDNRKGMLRASIYLKGGTESSGQFRYMQGTHHRDYHVTHKLSPDQIRELSNRIVDCEAPEGSLILFDPMGFHAKKPCTAQRRLLMIELQPRGANYPKARTLLPSNCLSERVLKNIHYFSDPDFSSPQPHGMEAYLKSPPALPISFLWGQLMSVALSSVKRRLVR